MFGIFFQQITGSGDFFVMRFWAVNSFPISGSGSYSKDLLHMGSVVAAFHYLLITPSHGPNLLFQWTRVGCSNHNTPHLLTCSFSRPKGDDPYPLYLYIHVTLRKGAICKKAHKFVFLLRLHVLLKLQIMWPLRSPHDPSVSGNKHTWPWGLFIG